jgi:hypothetical protein
MLLLIIAVLLTVGYVIELSLNTDKQAQNKFTIKKVMNDAVAARHDGVLPKAMSLEDLDVALRAGANYTKKRAAERLHLDRGTNEAP